MSVEPVITVPSRIRTTNTVPRYRALDGLRGIAALLVLLLHIAWSNHLTDLRFIQNSYLAVDLFFILSGFVIAANYSNRISDSRSAVRFIALRFFRIYPLHLAALAAFVGLECIKLFGQSALGVFPEHHPFTSGQSLQSLLINIFLLQGLGLLPTQGWNGPSWSISCEFCAYLLFVCVAWSGLLNKRAFLIFIAIIALIAYTALAIDRGTLNVVDYLGIVRCLAGFFSGYLIFRWSLIRSMQSLRLVSLLEMVVTVSLIVTMSLVSGSTIVIAFPLLILLVTLIGCNRGPVARLLESKLAQYLGRISYSVYMVHSLVIVCIIMALKYIAPFAYKPAVRTDFLFINPWSGDALLLGVVVVVIALSSRTYRSIELPWRMYGRNAFQLGSPAKQAVIVEHESATPSQLEFQ